VNTANNDIWRALPAMAENVPVAQVPAMMALLASAQSALAARLASASTDDASCSGDRFVSVDDLADQLRIGKSTIRRMIRDGELERGKHYGRAGRRILLDPVAVEAHLRETPTREVNRRAEGAIPFTRKERRREPNT